MGGCIIIGSEASIVMGTHSRNPEFIPSDLKNKLEGKLDHYESPGVWNGHYDTWLKACRGEGKVNSSFFDGGRLTETVLWGDIALRANSDLAINTATKEIIGNPEAQKLIAYPEPRKKWEL